MSVIGVIGGSALYDMDELMMTEKRRVKTPFGKPSDDFHIGKLEGKDVVFLPRHGRAHHLLPTEINFRANIYGFKTLGVERIISVAAVGSLKEDIRPLDVLLVDQFVDRTNQARQMTFFGGGIAAHVAFAEPICADLKEVIYRSNKDLDVKIHDGGTYLNMEGPAFSTRAESYLYKSWGMDVIGMTNMAEARLCREAGICYCTMAMVTDYDCWYLGSDVSTVSVEMVVNNLKKNMEIAKEMLKNTVRHMPPKRACSCSSALKGAIMTRKEAVPKKTFKDLRPIIEGFI